MRCAPWSLVGTLALAALPAFPAALRAQATAAHFRILQCADEAALAAGFHPIAVARPGWLGYTRPQDTPGFNYLLDTLVIGVGGDSSRTRLDLRLTSTEVSHMSNQSLGRVTPRPSLIAWADSVRARCNPH